MRSMASICNCVVVYYMDRQFFLGAAGACRTVRPWSRMLPCFGPR